MLMHDNTNNNFTLMRKTKDKTLKKAIWDEDCYRYARLCGQWQEPGLEWFGIENWNDVLFYFYQQVVCSMVISPSLV